MKTLFKFAMLILLVSAVGCQQSPIITPDPTPKEVISQEMDSLKIPLAFDWLTTSSLKLTATVDNVYPTSNYLVGVYDANPIFTPAASLLARGSVKPGETYSSSFTAPQGLQVVFVMQTDPKGKRVVQEYSTNGGTVNADFSSTSTAKSLRSAMVKTTPANVVSDYKVPSDAIVISNEGGVNSFTMSYGKKKHYVIKDSYTGSITYDGWGEGVELYVTGEWVNTGSSLRMSKGDKLIIMPEAKFETKTNVDISLDNSALIFVGREAKFEGGSSKVNIKASNGTEQLVNFGKMNIASASQFKLVYNTGEMNVGTIMFDTSESLVQNDRSMTIGTTDFTNGQLINECMLTVTELFNCKSKTTVDIVDGSLLKAKEMRSSGATFNIDANAMLNVTDVATFTSESSDLRGKGTAKNYGLVIFTKEVSEGWDAVKYMGNIEIECSNHAQNTLYNTLYTLNSASGARIVPKGASTVKIEGSECNDGGNDENEGDDDEGENSQYPQTVSLGTTYSYTFEDTYPNIGDYDMNDFVADATVSYKMSSLNKMSQLTMQVTLRALGGTKRLAAAIQLDGIQASKVSSVTRTGPALGSGTFSLSNGIETGQTYAVIPLTDDAHATLGMTSGYAFVNTRKEDAAVPAKTIGLTVNFSSPVDISNINIINMINLFIINDKYTASNRQEVHMKGYAATNKSTDISSGRDYSTASNIVYAIRNVGSFRYPKEYKSMLVTYPAFRTWLLTRGASNQNWYTLPNTGNIY